MKKMLGKFLTKRGLNRSVRQPGRMRIKVPNPMQAANQAVMQTLNEFDRKPDLAPF